MKESSITCKHCDQIIVEYYDERYRGTRGKCLQCGVNFPLE